MCPSVGTHIGWLVVSIRFGIKLPKRMPVECRDGEPHWWRPVALG